MDDLTDKSQEELEKIRQNSVVGGEIYVKTTHLVEKIQQDTNNKQIAAETKIEYKVTTEIEWAERMAQYWKKKGGTRISMMDFNQLHGQSKQRVRGEIRGNKN